MKKVLTLGMLGALISCTASPQQQGFSVKGHIDGMSGNQLFIVPPAGKGGKIKKVTVDATGSFAFSDTINNDGPAQYSLMDPRRASLFKGGATMGISYRFIARNGDRITITGTNDNFRWSTVTGDKLDEQLMELQSQTSEVEMQEEKIWNQVLVLLKQHDPANKPQIDSLTNLTDPWEARKKEITLHFIQQHPDYMVSAMALAGLSHSMPVAAMETAFLSLSKDVRQSSFAKEVMDNIGWGKAEISAEIGKPAAEFVKLDQKGKTIRLSDYRGKYVLLDFWGSWCAPCRASHPHLKEIYEKYGKEGLVIIGIAEERTTDKKAWLNAIREDGLPWIQIMNDEGKDKVDVVKLYGIQGFPTKILIDKDGNILERTTGTTMSASAHSPSSSSGTMSASAGSGSASSASARSAASSAVSSVSPPEPLGPLDIKLKEIFKN